MEGRPIAKLKTPRTAHGDVSNADRISKLPAQVLGLILSYLPIIDMVRTSILSSDWRYKWATVPNLVFDQSSSAIIDHVLLLHTGPIKMFKIEGIGAISNVDRWVPHVCRRSVKELVLKFGSFEQYTLLSCLSKCESLVRLELSMCLLSLPPCFEGFKSLKCLFFEGVYLVEDALEKLISSCPLLEEFTFINFEQFYSNLKINARNLRCLDIKGDFRNITFGHTMDRLLVFSFEQFSTDYSIDLEVNLAEILTNLPSIQRFVLKSRSLEDLYKFIPGLVPESVPIQCKDLYHLEISLTTGCPFDSLAALYLFKCAPNLTELEIECIYSMRGLALWWDTSEYYWEFKKLRLVKMKVDNISSKRGGMKFIQFLLASSPVLEKMILTSNERSNYINWKDVRRMCESKRASADAKIILDGHLIL